MQSFPLHYIGVGLLVVAATMTVALALTLGAHPSTYAAVAALGCGSMTVVWFSWRNALPTDTVAQLLHRTEVADRNDRSFE
jgi:hypothetical protein